MNSRVILVIFFLIILVHRCYEGYINFLDVSYQGSEKNCPQIHADNYTQIRTYPQAIQPFGYTNNEHLDLIRFIKTDVPLPTNPDFITN